MSASVASPPAQAPGTSRLGALDALRGLIMILMALDHANVFIAHEHPAPEFWLGPAPWHASALSFLTRFVTHLAAPGFFFLMGSGMILFTEHRGRLGWSRGRIARHFLLRGALLMLLQFLVEDPAWSLASAGRPLMPGTEGPVYVGVLFGLGAAMILGSLVVWLRTRWLLGLSLLAILATQTVFATSLEPHGHPPLWLQLLLVPSQGARWMVYYPVVPWLGVMGLGMAFGRGLQEERFRFGRRVGALGAGCVLLFLGVRLTGVWGNLHLVPGEGWMAFLHLVKYPPSLAFLLLTLGVDLLLLAALMRAEVRLGSWLEPLRVFGANPLLFYLAHLYLYGFIGLRFHPVGTGIPRMLPFWLAGLVLLYLLCRGFGAFKRRQPSDSVWRFL